jgi:hypothetical protein
LAVRGWNEQPIHGTRIALGERRLRVLNGKLRDECLNGEILYSLREEKMIIEQRRIHYNT